MRPTRSGLHAHCSLRRPTRHQINAFIENISTRCAPCTAFFVFRDAHRIRQPPGARRRPLSSDPLRPTRVRGSTTIRSGVVKALGLFPAFCRAWLHVSACGAPVDRLGNSTWTIHGDGPKHHTSGAHFPILSLHPDVAIASGPDAHWLDRTVCARPREHRLREIDGQPLVGLPATPETIGGFWGVVR